MKKTLLIITILLVSTKLFAISEVTQRYSLIIGKNYGGKSRSTLNFATNDAKDISRIILDYSGVKKDDNILLFEPSKQEIIDKFTLISSKLKSNLASNVRKEFIFYYSGHSDEEGLLVGNDKIFYAELKNLISKITSDVKVIILDSCSSGAFTKTKGGQKQPSFLSDNSTKLKGYVYLTSASSDEAAQESRKIKGSYFTHYLKSGLRGAADSSDDGRVTLNEAYGYAYNETLARTEKTLAGAQHPSYDMHLEGSGELVMTDIRTTNARLLINENLEGRFFIRNSKGDLEAEVKKQKGKKIEIGLEPGEYTVLMEKTGFYESKLNLVNNQTTNLEAKNLKQISADSNPLKGDAANYEHCRFELAVIPRVSTCSTVHENTLKNFSLSLAYAEAGVINGVMISTGATWVRDSVQGVQVSTFANLNYGDTYGLQASSFNKTQKIEGVQVGSVNLSKELHGFSGGFYNKSDELTGATFSFINSNKKVKGIAVGFVNVADYFEGLPLGFINIIKNGTYKLGYSIDENATNHIVYKSGAKYFYSLADFGLASRNSNTYYFFGMGLGAQVPVYNDLFLNTEMINYSVMKNTLDFRESSNLFKLIVAPAYRIFDHIDLSVGISLNYLERGNNELSQSFRTDFKGGTNKDYWTGMFLAVDYKF